MAENKNVLKLLTKYFILSTLIPFLLIIIINVLSLSMYYRNELMNVTNSYVASLSREISLYTNQLKQILITPNWSNAASEKIRNINQKPVLTLMDRNEFEHIMGSLISSIRYTGNDFYSAIITNGRDVIYSSSNYIEIDPFSNYNWKKESWFRKAVNEPEKIHYIPRHVPQYYEDNSQPEVLSLVTTVRNLITQEPYAVVKIDFLPSKLSQNIDLSNFNFGSCLFIEDEQNNIIEEVHSEEKMLNLAKKMQRGEDISSHAFIIKKQITDTPYTLTVLLNIWEIRMESLKISAIGFLLYLLALLTAILLNRRFSRRITAPIEQMKTVFSHVQQGDFSMRYEPEPNWELEDLGQSLNEMTEELEENIKKTYLAEIAQKEAEKKALLSQIQPHFLFNTLNTMVSLLYEQRYDELEQDLFALSDILRNALNKEQTCRLADEITFLNDYMSLQQSRFGTRLEWETDIPEDTKEVIIPKLLLQPFIENSVIHGMEPSTKICHVSVSAKKKGNEINIFITDDGVGFNPKETDTTNSIGITNSKERLKLLYQSATTEIKSSIGKGCSIHLKFDTGDFHETTSCR